MPALSDTMTTLTDALSDAGIEYTASMRWDSNGNIDGLIDVYLPYWHDAMPVLISTASVDPSAVVVATDNYIAVRAGDASIRCRPAGRRPLPPAVAMGGAA